MTNRLVRSWTGLLLLLCFTCSGMSGLIYEVSWVRLMELVFGATTYAVATVLAVFMGGLALGSYLLGRRIRSLRSFHPLRVYALLEVGIAGCALAVPLLVQAFVPLEQVIWAKVEASFTATTVIRFGLSSAVLLVPTLLMGATLPLISELASKTPELGRRFVGALYAANTTGAVVGCALAGLVLFPRLGLTQTQWVAVALNLLAAAAAWKLSFSLKPASQETYGPKEDPMPGTSLLREQDAEATPDERRGLVGMYAVSGFIAMLYEVSWSRVLVLVLGSSIYAYSIMLTTFLFGLAAGAWIGSRWMVRRSYAFHGIAAAQLLIMGTTSLGVQWVEDLPYWYLRAYETLLSSPQTLLWIQFLFCSALMILPTLGLGAMFPMVLNGLQSKGESTGGVVGWAYAWNTLGAILGSLAAGFVLVPVLGTQTTLLAGMMLNAGICAWALSFLRRGALARIRRPAGAAVVGTACLALWVTPGWDPAVLSAGIFRYADTYLGLSKEGFKSRVRETAGEILFHDEGLTCTVTIARSKELVKLKVNGKPDASTPTDVPNPYAKKRSTEQGDLGTQILLGQIPLLLAPRIEDVLVVGFGSGVTLGSTLTHPVKRVDCLELEQSVIRGSRFFEHCNGKPLQDPRTRLIVNDARHHLLVSDRRYDVIISEPSNPWIPGAANLFTQEFFNLGRSRLNPEGLFCLWLQMYEIQPEHFELILRTFSSVFPDMHVFRNGSDAIVLGSVSSHGLDVGRMQARWTPAVRQDLERLQGTRVEDVLAYYWIGGRELAGQIRPGSLNTDDNRRIEFAAPLDLLTRKGSKSGQVVEVNRLFDGHTTGVLPQIKSGGPSLDWGFWLALAEPTFRSHPAAEALRYAMKSMVLKPSPQALRLAALATASISSPETALSILAEFSVRPPLPPSGVTPVTLALSFLESESPRFPAAPALFRARSELLVPSGRWDEIRRIAVEWSSAAPRDSLATYTLGVAEFQLKNPTAALQAMESVRKDLWGSADASQLPFYLGSLYWSLGRHEDAVPCLQAVLDAQPMNSGVRLKLIDSLQRTGQQGDATSQCEMLVRMNSAQADGNLRRGLEHLQTGDYVRASAELERAVILKPWDADMALRLALAYESLGKWQDAAELLETYLEKHSEKAPVVGYLSKLLHQQNQRDRAKTLAARYKVLTGEEWDVK